MQGLEKWRQQPAVVSRSAAQRSAAQHAPEEVTGGDEAVPPRKDMRGGAPALQLALGCHELGGVAGGDGAPAAAAERGKVGVWGGGGGGKGGMVLSSPSGRSSTCSSRKRERKALSKAA